MAGRTEELDHVPVRVDDLDRVAPIGTLDGSDRDARGAQSLDPRFQVDLLEVDPHGSRHLGLQPAPGGVERKPGSALQVRLRRMRVGGVRSNGIPSRSR